jgi:hypothetical protein
MEVKGDLRKMKTELKDKVEYTLTLSGESVVMNDLIGKQVTISHTGTIHCVDCGVVTKKSFGQGFCYPCFQKSPMNSECIIRPELCEAHLGNGRNPEWEESHHNTDHYVYLAASSGVKVGVTRADQIPTRWIDQGASRGILLAEVPYRQLAGEIEVALKEHISDKTAWQRMLKNEQTDSDLVDLKEEMISYLDESYHDFISDEDDVIEIEYPVDEFPEKVKSNKLEKVGEITGILKGIKGQYLIFDEGRVMNVRSHSGFEVVLKA